MHAIAQDNARRVSGLVEDFEHAIAGHSAPVPRIAAGRRMALRSLFERLSRRSPVLRPAGPAP